MKFALPLSLVALFASGCDREQTTKIAPASRDLGTGLNTIERTYGRAPADLVSVVQRSLLALDLRIDSERHDNLGGEIVAIRATGQKITVTLKGLESSRSSVSVRVEPGDRDLANLVHDKITEHLVPVEGKSRQP